MATQKVTILTGISQKSGNEILKKLVKSNRKVIVLGDIAENFSFADKGANALKVTTELPVTAATFQDNDVQFSFGDMSDISFLAAVFTQAHKNGLEIELVCHISDITAESSAHFSFGDTINLLEIVKAYWQSNQDTFKCFFYAADAQNPAASKIEKLLNSAIKKEHFPAKIYIKRKPLKAAPTLYRLFSPLTLPKVTDTQPEDSLTLTQAFNDLLAEIAEN